jgi:hypothetical protein
LDERLKHCIAQFSRIGESTPDACKSKAALKATYRFAKNQRVDMGQIFAEHNRASRQRCSAHKRVLLLQDTTDVDLTKPKRQVEGAGPLGTDHRRGFFYHPLYAVTEDGVSLGVVDQVIWTRDPESLKLSAAEKKEFRRKACFEEKESCRWFEMLQSGDQLARCHPETTFILVADSEADIYELFCDTPEFSENYHLIVRGCHSRSITSATDSVDSQVIEATNVVEALDQAKPRFHREVWIGGRDEPVTPDNRKRARKQPREPRRAVLTMKAVTVTISGPPRPGVGSLPNRTLNVVEAREENPPEGDTPVHWFLFTTLPVDSDEDIEAVIEGYRMRWVVEVYFKTLKSGLRIEDLKYRFLDRYLVAFAMLAVVAWRIEHLKTAARARPDAPCSDYYQRDEWMAIVTFVTRQPADPAKVPTMQEFVLLVAQLGGYIKTRSQGPPGSKTIWRGMAQFATIVEAYRIFAQKTYGV